MRYMSKILIAFRDWHFLNVTLYHNVNSSKKVIKFRIPFEMLTLAYSHSIGLICTGKGSHKTKAVFFIFPVVMVVKASKKSQCGKTRGKTSTFSTTYHNYGCKSLQIRRSSFLFSVEVWLSIIYLHAKEPFVITAFFLASPFFLSAPLFFTLKMNSAKKRHLMISKIGKWKIKCKLKSLEFLKSLWKALKHGIVRMFRVFDDFLMQFKVLQSLNKFWAVSKVCMYF